MKNAWRTIRNKTFGDYLGFTIVILALFVIYFAYNRIGITQFIIADIILGFISLIPVFMCLMGLPNYEILDYLKANDMSTSDFDEEMEQAFVVKKNHIMCICGPRFAIKTGLKNRLIDYSNLARIKPMRTEMVTSTYGTRTATQTNGSIPTVVVRLFYKDGSNPSIVPVNTVEEAMEMCRYIHARNPMIEFLDEQ